MKMLGPDVQAILHKYGYTTEPGVVFQESIVQQEGDKLYIDINAFSVRYGADDDLVPDYPIRVYLKKNEINPKVLDTVAVVQLTKGDKTNAETRNAGGYPARSPWAE